MIRKDLPKVLKIEEESFQFPWQKNEFLAYLTKRNCIGIVAESASKEQIAAITRSLQLLKELEKLLLKTSPSQKIVDRINNIQTELSNLSLGTIAGYAVYLYEECQIVIINFAVAKDWQKQGVGKMMLEKLIEKGEGDSTKRTIVVSSRENKAMAFFEGHCVPITGALPVEI